MDPKQRCKLASTHRKFVTVHVQALYVELEFLRVFLVLVCSLPMKSRKTFDRDNMYTSAAHTCIVHDVTDMVIIAVLMAIYMRLSKVSV